MISDFFVSPFLSFTALGYLPDFLSKVSRSGWAYFSRPC